MTRDEKISWLQQHAPGPYARAAAEAINELDELTPMFCFCGKLATGLHTSHCRKFNERKKTLIIKKLKGLLPDETVSKSH